MLEVGKSWRFVIIHFCLVIFFIMLAWSLLDSIMPHSVDKFQLNILNIIFSVIFSLIFGVAGIGLYMLTVKPLAKLEKELKDAN